jgi:hypothetical protein
VVVVIGFQNPEKKTIEKKMIVITIINGALTVLDGIMSIINGFSQ